MTNPELAAAIEATLRMMRSTASTEAVNPKLAAHLDALLAEQVKRAQA